MCVDDLCNDVRETLVITTSRQKLVWYNTVTVYLEQNVIHVQAYKTTVHTKANNTQ